MPRMRIVYIHQYFTSPSMAGGTRSFEMARRMVSAGHDVHVITSIREPSPSTRDWVTQTIDGVNVHWYPVPYANQMGYKRRILAFVQFAFAATRRALLVGGDVVFATSPPLTIAIPGVIAARRLRVPMVFEVRDLWPELPIAMGAIRNSIAKGAARSLERFAYRNSARVIALSSGMADGIAKAGYPRSRIAVIPNACDIEMFLHPAKPLPWGADFTRQMQTGPLVVYCGTLGAVNGVSFLVKVAAASHAVDAGTQFLVVGDGMEWDKVQALARREGVLNRNFHMRSPIAKDEVPALLAIATLASSLVIDLPELRNNSANKFFDALAAGRPVVINYEGWQRTILESSGAGFAVSPNDPIGAARAIREFVHDRQRVNLAASAARNLARQHFDRDRLAMQLIAVLEHVVETAQR